MTFEIPADLNPKLMGLAWLIGRWEGNGHGSWPGEGEFEYGQQIDFATNGGPYLHYVSQLFEQDEEGRPTRCLAMETGFWRPTEDNKLDVVLCDPQGWSEVWAGTVSGAKIQLVSDAVMRTTTAAVPYTGGQRLYGNVEGDLLWTFDRAADGVPLQPYLWARLRRAGALGTSGQTSAGQTSTDQSSTGQSR